MKKTLLLFCILFTVIAFGQDYKKEWAKVLEKETEGEVKKAAALTDAIYKKAKRNKNQPQVIKAFFFKAKYMQVIEEDAQFKIISNIQADIKVSPFASKAILKSLYAQMLETIYNKNSNRIRIIINTKGPNPTDYRLWSAQNFSDEIDKAYTESLDKKLYSIPLADYDAIIDFAPSTRDLKRSLYDFLAEQYLDYLWANADIRYHSYFTSNISALFGSSEDFLALKISDSLPQSASKGLKLLSETEGFFYKNNDVKNLQRSVLRRLSHMDANIYSDGKYAQSLATVSVIEAIKPTSPYTYNSKLVKAKLLTQMANKTKLSNYLIEAVKLYDEIINAKAVNDIAAEAYNLRNSIINKQARVHVSQHMYPETPQLASVSFKNLDSITIRFYNISNNEILEKDDSQYIYRPTIKPVLQKKYILPNRNDFFTYTTEIILPPLPVGTYAMTVSYMDEDNIFTCEKIYVSHMSIIQHETNENNFYTIVDKITGKPIEKVVAIIPKNPVLRTDKEGRIMIKKTSYTNRNHWEYITFVKEADTVSDNFNPSYLYNDNHHDHTANVQLYLDKPIYRPGQTVYFKGIASQWHEGKYSVVSDTYFSILIENDTYDEITKFRLKTNEYGSFTDKVELPKNMTGRFRISVEEDDDEDEYKNDDAFWDDVYFNRSEVDFNVEEYKRPTFEIIFDKIKNDIRLNESVKAKAYAKTFSGTPVTDSKVKYRVERTKKRYWYDPYGQNEKIADGETITDTKGEFFIQFNTEPGEHNPDEKPIFTYTLFTDVTDITGETRSESYSFNASYDALAISVSIPDIISVKNKNIVKLETNTINGEFLPAKGSLTIYKVSSSNKFYMERPWLEPELQTLTEKEFSMSFPHIPYKKFNDSLLSKEPIFTHTINTAITKDVLLTGTENWISGKYEIIFKANDSIGNEIVSKKRFTLTNNNDKIPSDKKLFEYQITNKDYAKDGYVELTLKSGLQLYVNVTAICDDKLLYGKLITLPTGSKTIKIPVLKSPKKSMAINMAYVWQNKYYKHDLNIIVPRKTEYLSFETETLKSKILPGSEQKWSFTIKGSGKKSEVLASMYDASLDRLLVDNDEYYRNDYWVSPDIYDYRYSSPYQSRLLTDNTISPLLTESLKKVVLSKNTDSFYMYGFDFDNVSNSYYTYVPKSQMPEKGDFIVNGIVTDEIGMPIPGATVIIEGSSEGVQTDFDGKFSIYAAKGEQIAFTYIGMKKSVITVTEGLDLNISLKDDAKLLQDVVVEAYRTTTRATSNIAVTTVTSKTVEGRPNANYIQTLQGQVPGINITTGAGQPGAGTTVIIRGTASVNGIANPLYIIDGVSLSENDFKNLSEDEIADLVIFKDKQEIAIYGIRGANGVVLITTKKGIETLQQVKARKNFNETAFFYPQLRTDKNGKFSFSFTTPEALTEWKLRMMAHNKNAASGYYENTFFTQKDLMIVPNMPRFLREKDTIVLIAKVTNLTNDVKTGNALLQLFDAATMQPADVVMMNTANLKPFTIPAKGNTTVSWKITIPKGMQGVQYKVLAKAGDFTDGEENILPVLTNSIMVTESIPLWVKPNSTKEYTYKAFEKSLSNPAITQIGMTLEYTSNPAWLAIKSLPYLMEFEHECAEQVFSRYYANSIAAHILNSSPKIAEVFAAWRKADKPLSKFEQNEELKSIVMAETPWILDNQSDEEIKNRLAVLFDLEKMKVSLESNFTKLQNKQASSGGFPWFEGGKESYYITRHIAAGFGHLNKLGINAANKKEIDALTLKAVKFMDSEFLKDYEYRKTYSKEYTTEMLYDGMHYLYARSFYTEQYPIAENQKKIIDEYLASVSKSTAYFKYKWLDYTLYQKGMLALALNRYGYKDMAKKILNHLKETSSTNEEWGMYWIENKAGWYWYQAPVETQALLIEAFTEVNNDIASADAMKVWLLKNKQNKNWPTTKATTEAVYSLLMQGSDWLSVKDNTVFKLGDKEAFDEKLSSNEKEAGTGYIKLQWKADEIKEGMGTLQIENKSAVPGFGGYYWQRSYEEADKDYTPQQEPLSINKELFIKSNTADGSLLTPVSQNKPFKIGDLVTVRLTVNAKEDMEYLHLKDMRASAFEPIDVLSQRKYQSGISYYQSTRDVATNFFFDSMKKGIYIFEYDVRVNNAGEFSNGIATIQSMYAPEFKGNSNAVRIHVEQ